MQGLYDSGYSAMDIIGTLFRVTRNNTQLHEFVKLEFMKVCGWGRGGEGREAGGWLCAAGANECGGCWEGLGLEEGGRGWRATV